MTRTHDLLITNQLLYRLSYTSVPSSVWNHSFNIISNVISFVNPLSPYFREKSLPDPGAITKS